MRFRVQIKLKQLSLIAPLFLGAVIFLSVAGHRILDPSNIAWLADGDPATHYLGWDFYRSSEWSFPIGLNPRYGAELSSSIVFSDSLPLFGILLKPLSSMLPQPFQYFGFWVLLCFLLQTWFGWLLTGLVSTSALTKLLGAALFVVAPAMLWNFYPGIGTLALGGHFLILGALYLLLSQRPGVRWTAWCLLMSAATLVHAYLLAMVLTLWFADIADRVLRKEVQIAETARSATFLLIVIGLIAWQAGYFLFAEGLDAWGYGFFRINLLGLFDPSKFLTGSWSYILPDIPGDQGNPEGFNFLGLGVILLLISCLMILIAKGSRIRRLRSQRPFFLGSLLVLTAFAVTNNIGLGAYSIELPIPGKIQAAAAIFRASGRMFWPALYALLCFIIYYVIQHTPRRAGQLLLGVALLVQITDSSQGLMGIRSSLWVEPRSHWSTNLVNPFWNAISDHYTSIKRIYPGSREHWKEISYLAAGAGLSTDIVYLGRISAANLKSATEKRQKSLETGIYDAETIFIIDENLLAQSCRTVRSETDLLTRIDGLIVLAPGWKTFNETIPGENACYGPSSSLHPSADYF